MTQIGEPVETESPSFLIASKDQKYLYSTHEHTNGGVTSWKIDQTTYELTKINTVETGAHTCSIALNYEENKLVCSNYASSSLALFEVRKDGGLTKIDTL